MVIKERIFTILIMALLRNFDVVINTRKFQSCREIESNRRFEFDGEITYGKENVRFQKNRNK